MSVNSQQTKSNNNNLQMQLQQQQQTIRYLQQQVDFKEGIIESQTNIIIKHQLSLMIEQESNQFLRNFEGQRWKKLLKEIKLIKLKKKTQYDCLIQCWMPNELYFACFSE